MAHAGQELHGQDGYILRLVSIEPELLQMEATYGGTGQFPPRHYHPSQDEHFEVLEGTVRTIVDGEERSYNAGETFDIPAGTVHQLAADPPARLKWEVRPALRTADFFETVYSGEIPPDLRERFSAEVVFLL
jgi:quercetin dioxygenase-like cupin family protein